MRIISTLLFLSMVMAETSSAPYKCHHPWKSTGGLCTLRDDNEPLKFFEALSKCQSLNDEDISTINMAKVGDIHHFDPPTRYFTHKIWINAVKWQGTWYQFNQAPSSSSETFDDYIANGIVSVIPMMVMEHLGLESSSGFDNAGVIFNPFEKALEIFNIDEKRSYICTHQKTLPTHWKKWKEWERITGPKCKNSKIGVVGAGPSGVHMAYLLKQNGFKHVEILEKTNELGGKSQTLRYRGTDQGFSTMFFTATYIDTLIPLLQKFNLYDGNTVQATFQVNYWPTNDPQTSTLSPRQQFTVSWIMSNLKISTPEAAVLQLQQDLQKYTELHQDFFGDYQYQIMRRPISSVMEKFSGTILDFIAANELYTLIPIYEGLFQLTGYNVLHDTASIYGAIWGSPLSLTDAFANGGLMLREGAIDDIYPKMIEEENIHVKYNYEVEHIWRNPDGKLEVRSKCNMRDEYDFVVWSGPPSGFEQVANENVIGRYDRHLFKSSRFSHSATSIVNMQNGGVAAGPFLSFFENQVPTPPELFSDKVVLAFDTYAVAQEISQADYSAGSFTYGDGKSPADSSYTTSVLQYGNVSKPFPSLNELHTELKSHLEKFGATDIEVLNTRTFDYFPRWDRRDAAKQFHWDMYDIQGKNDIWFVGGGLSFESLTNLIGYNQLLLDMMHTPYDHC